MADPRPAAGPVRLGLIGCGTAAVPVAEALAASPLTALAAVYDLNAALARELSERYQVPAAESAEALLANPAVEAVYIAVPHDRLAGLAGQALRAGKPVLVEKPLALHLAEADALIALADERGLTLDVYYEMRHIAPYAQARAILQAGGLGTVIGARVQTLIDKDLAYWQAGYAGRSRNPWRGRKDQAGGGVVLMNSSHALDALSFVTGLDVVSVAAEVGALVAPVEVEDTAAAVLRFSNGAIGSLMAGAHIAGAQADETFEVYGTRGQLRLPHPYGPGPLRLYLREAFQDLAAGQWHSLPNPLLPVHTRAVEAFAQAVRSGVPSTAGARQARQTLAVVLALYQSAAERKTIQVPGRLTNV